MKTQFIVLLRSHSRIKSRHWWILNLSNALKIIFSKLPVKFSTKYKKTTFTLLLTNDDEIHDLNNIFRKKNKPTDVLSFNQLYPLESSDKSLGDIVISVDTAIKQASEKALPLESELILLFVHGYLHLLGFDHIKIKDAKTMFKYQNEIMKDILY